MLRGVNLAPFLLGDLSQSEKYSEIKPLFNDDHSCNILAILIETKAVEGLGAI